MKTTRTSRASSAGFSLIEMLVVGAIAGIALTMALPSLGNMLDKHRLGGAASQLASDLQYARAEAVLRSQAVRMSFHQTAGGACYIVHTGATADCLCGDTGAGQCSAEARALRTVRLDAEQRLALQSNVPSVRFDPVHGTASPAATVRLTGPQGLALNQVVNLMGRVRTCSPQGTVSGYRIC